MVVSEYGPIGLFAHVFFEKGVASNEQNGLPFSENGPQIIPSGPPPKI